MTDWVLARSRCTAAYYIGELVKVIRRDVDRFNRLERTQDSNRFFVVESESDGCTVRHARIQRFADGKNQFIRASDPDSDFVRVSHTDSGLLAERRDFWKLEVKMQWNPATLQCDLMMDGEARPLDYVSQRAVGDFLFEDWCA